MLERAELAAYELNKICPRRSWTEDNFYYYDGLVRLKRNCRATCPCYDYANSVITEVNYPSTWVYVGVFVFLVFFSALVKYRFEMCV